MPQKSIHLRFHFPGFFRAFLSCSCQNLIFAPFCINILKRSHLPSIICYSSATLNTQIAKYKGHLCYLLHLHYKVAEFEPLFAKVLTNVLAAMYWILLGPLDFPIWAVLRTSKLNELILTFFSSRKMALGLAPISANFCAFQKSSLAIAEKRSWLRALGQLSRGLFIRRQNINLWIITS